MTRISQSELSRNITNDILRNHVEFERAGQQMSSGYKVQLPGDADTGGQISDFRSAIQRLDAYQTQIAPLSGALAFQESIIQQSTDILTRAKEIGTQGANGTLGPEARESLSREVFQLRDQLVALANSTYQGRFIYSGAASNTPPFSATTYATPSTGPESQRFVFTTQPGATIRNSVTVSDSQSIVANTPGNQVFSNSIIALERLGRALSGYSTNPATGTPDGTGAAYNQPAQYPDQTRDIQNAITLLNSAANDDLLPERTDIGARISRLETTMTMLRAAKAGAEDSLSNLQNADSVTAATALQQAQFALQASLQVSAKVLNMSILDYL